MKKLLAIAVLGLSLAGCKTACNDYTIFPCKDRCITKGAKCECNHKEKCCEWKDQPENKITTSAPR